MDQIKFKVNSLKNYLHTANISNLVFFFIVFPCNIICTGNDNYDDDLEDEMELRFERDGHPVTLRLKKNDNVQHDVPVYTSKDNVIRKVDTTAMPVSTIQIIWTHLPTKAVPTDYNSISKLL